MPTNALTRIQRFAEITQVDPTKNFIFLKDFVAWIHEDSLNGERGWSKAEHPGEGE